MTVKECYEKMGADYEDVLQRLMNDTLITKFLHKFMEKNPYADIETALAAEDYETAFRHAHSLKGVCLNLSFTKMFESSNALCEELRNGKPQKDITPLLEQVKSDYNQVVEAIRSL
jgi:HPt (histidine-containing phosphotransfer) domain-containing protein